MKNPNGTLTNLDLELAGGLLHLDALVQAFDVRERTALYKGDNLLGMKKTAPPTTSLLLIFCISLEYINDTITMYLGLITCWAIQPCC